MILNHSNVRITANRDSGCLDITTDDESYDATRAALLLLRERAGMPLSLLAEDTAAMILKLREGRGLRSDDGSVRTDVPRPRLTTNSFTIPVWKINVRDDRLPLLAEEVADHLRSIGLTVNVF